MYSYLLLFLAVGAVPPTLVLWPRAGFWRAVVGYAIGCTLCLMLGGFLKAGAPPGYPRPVVFGVGYAIPLALIGPAFGIFAAILLREILPGAAAFLGIVERRVTEAIQSMTCQLRNSKLTLALLSIFALAALTILVTRSPIGISHDTERPKRVTQTQPRAAVVAIVENHGAVESTNARLAYVDGMSPQTIEWVRQQNSTHCASVQKRVNAPSDTVLQHCIYDGYLNAWAASGTANYDLATEWVSERFAIAEHRDARAITDTEAQAEVARLDAHIMTEMQQRGAMAQQTEALQLMFLNSLAPTTTDCEPNVGGQGVECTQQ